MFSKRKLPTARYGADPRPSAPRNQAFERQVFLPQMGERPGAHFAASSSMPSSPPSMPPSPPPVRFSWDRREEGTQQVSSYEKSSRIFAKVMLIVSLPSYLSYLTPLWPKSYILWKRWNPSWRMIFFVKWSEEKTSSCVQIKHLWCKTSVLIFIQTAWEVLTTSFC